MHASPALLGSQLIFPDRRLPLNVLLSALSVSILSAMMESPLAAYALLALLPTSARPHCPSIPPAPLFVIRVLLDSGPAVAKHLARLALLEHGVEQPVLTRLLIALAVRPAVTAFPVLAALPIRVAHCAKSEHIRVRQVKLNARSAQLARMARLLVVRPTTALVRCALPVLTTTKKALLCPLPASSAIAAILRIPALHRKQAVNLCVPPEHGLTTAFIHAISVQPALHTTSLARRAQIVARPALPASFQMPALVNAHSALPTSRL